MKKFILYISAAICLMGINTSCSDFGDVNNDPEHLNPGNMNYSLMFTQVESQIAGSDWDIWRNGLIYCGNMLQHTISATWSYGVFYTWSEGYNAAYWDGYYSGGRAAIRNIVEVMDNWKDNPTYANEYQYSRVLRAYMFHRMTDLYGDVPYFDAGKSTSGIKYPKYDTQEAIYNDMLKELDEVNTELSNPSSANTIGAADVIFGGDAEKWRKFANSLMLRLAMRLTKIDAAKATTWATKAVANGVIDDMDDNAILKHVEGSSGDDSAEPFGKILSESEPLGFYMSEYFINALKSTADPRLQLIATKCTVPDSKWSSGNGFDLGDSSDPTKLIGLPIGYETADGDWNIGNAPGYPGDDYWKSHYALVNRKTYARPDVPSMLVTYTETCFLLADAAERGFITGGTAAAKTYFEKGVRAAMEQFSYYTAARTEYETYLSAANVNAYVTARLAEFDANPLKEINWQYYVNTFGDEYETFANWRRTGYPELKSVYEPPYNRPEYPNRATSEIPRRFTYPSNESQINSTNYKEAVSRLKGGDYMSSRVWWDKE
ncbi:MAG: SusD/RagB family nutrient-binding outer membrane lipoprotein [Dysgonomonas sp.]|nr:SusD/RagB family nutrient-binding outer membrane lipoprotein [Dysgonomonas sp.]